jgi:hypothetical protein
MTGYVHELGGQSRSFGQNSTDPWFVLTAGTEDELHAFAATLGLTRVMFRPGTPAGRHQKPVAPHYDITSGERDRAVALGAQPRSDQR